MKRLLISLLLLSIFPACSDKVGFYAVDQAITASLEEEVFAQPSSPYYTEVNDLNDSETPNLTSHQYLDPQFITRCTKERFFEEKLLALKEAQSSPQGDLIPVQFAISVGSQLDEAAFFAHHRSILRTDHDLEHPVNIGPQNSFAYKGSRSLHYITDPSQARSDFIHGKRCFFSTIRVKKLVQGPVLFEGRYNHTYALLMYGNVDRTMTKNFAPSPDGENKNVLYPRLFEPLNKKSAKSPQILPLYLADIRNEVFVGATKKEVLLNPAFESSAQRRKEYTESFKDIFNLKTMWTHRREFVRRLSTVKPHRFLCKRDFSAYEAAPQLIDWIVFSGLNAVVTSTQYTPLVLDLGRKHIQTSSAKWGTFFNFANMSIPGKNKFISHLTAWLGGEIEQKQNPTSIEATYYERDADDGFLVITNRGGMVEGPHELFGDSMPVGEVGQETTYPNGFETLIALAKKDCNSTSPKDKFIGPWDGTLYSKTLKIWVDTNRNGVSEPSEIKGLKESGVLGLGVCYFSHKKEEDRFGNQTKLRAPFLYAEDYKSLASRPDEVLKQLDQGIDEDGNPLNLRIMIDIYFKAMPEFYLESRLSGPLPQ